MPPGCRWRVEQGIEQDKSTLRLVRRGARRSRRRTVQTDSDQATGRQRGERAKWDLIHLFLPVADAHGLATDDDIRPQIVRLGIVFGTGRVVMPRIECASRSLGRHYEHADA